MGWQCKHSEISHFNSSIGGPSATKFDILLILFILSLGTRCNKVNLCLAWPVPTLQTKLHRIRCCSAGNGNYLWCFTTANTNCKALLSSFKCAIFWDNDQFKCASANRKLKCLKLFSGLFSKEWQCLHWLQAITKINYF